MWISRVAFSIKMEVMNNEVINKLKDEYQKKEFYTEDIPNLINSDYLREDNEKYMKMYNKWSYYYDFAEKVLMKFMYGYQVNRMRQEMMNKLEWKDNASVLYISIGTGNDLEFIPKSIDKKSLTICGIDISLGMLKKCKRNFGKTLKLSLFNGCAEDLPFKDNSFDVVFNVGGINFYNDKQKALDEMIRVAKDGTKLLIADETNSLIEEQYKKSSFTKKYYNNKEIDISEIEKLIPATVKERETDVLWNGKFYCITFRK